MKITAKQALTLLLVVILIIWTFQWLNRPEPIPVKLHRVKKGTVKETVSNTRVGTVKACRRALLAPGSGGEVIALNVHEGDQVEPDQVLLEVWNHGLKAQVALQEAEIKSAEAKAAQSCHSAAGTSRAAKRLQELKQHNHIVSEEAVDLANTRSLAGKAACRAARLQVQISQARLKAAQAGVERTMIRAPFSGTVAEVNAELGEFITPSPPGIPTLPAIDLIDAQCLYISAPIDEVDAPLIKTGMSACVSLDAFPDARCSGTVQRIAPYVLEKEKQARTVEVEVKLTDPEQLHQLMPGYSADIEVLISQHDNSLRIPTEAIFDGNHIWVVDAQGIVENRSIETGLSNWHFTEVLQGLKAGDTIILTAGREGLQSGVTVVAEHD